MKENNKMTQKAHAKINTFLKITGHQNGYHTLLSRFVKVPNLYDVISFIPQECKSFTIEGCGDVPVEVNTIYKSFVAMQNELTIYTDFFKHHKVVVKKNIPSGAGLGGGSSDAAAFMRLFNEVCKLNIDTPTLAKIGSSVGADIPFFVYDYDAANVSGFGEVVEKFEDESFEIELYTPNIHCDTALVYKTFKRELFDKIEPTDFDGWENLSSKEVLNSVDAIMANDLYKASLIAYPKLKEEQPKGWYFSGSGSTFFRIK
ncbi:MAG: 4-diphosphocytidyl-2-C-methyl-D-erythritol kinase (EC [uncultured Sulfurovum sp.]|uniref:4-(cytidine 5'-diphospho)-2-C-methyl-D-erythritol kinase n=1 Tax=uncultured Sulfurovum sp. TaxID=269237 RepID=A0A6S6S7A5_9BACT|nr:MAG: 4-diphosphocytidyl-2-C-methyl-D-erythritol kinase (EC [uncultured Sulfurovum sp.]